MPTFFIKVGFVVNPFIIDFLYIENISAASAPSAKILMFKSSLTENAKKRLNILKSSTDGFKISEEDNNFETDSTAPFMVYNR